MGYESKIIIGYMNSSYDNVKKKYVDSKWAENLATLNLCKMGSDFNSIFDKEIDFRIYDENSALPLSEDRYGEKCKYTDIDTVINWLKKFLKKEDYRRAIMLYDFLKSFQENRSAWEYEDTKGNITNFAKIFVIHYGY